MTKAKNKNTAKRYEQAAAALLDWYDVHRRELPWRATTDAPNPYHVWLSEVMLQQTTVATVKGYFKKFTQKWPDIQSLATAPRDEVMAAWAGLGYYARARHMHAAAQIITDDYGGIFPKVESELRKLPGVGDYTAAAIAAIAYGQKATVIDGNIERVIARWANITTPLPKAKPEIRLNTAAMTPDSRCGDFAQAMMDLGSSICIPALTAVHCGQCPMQKTCLTPPEVAPTLPIKAPKKKRPDRYGIVLVIRDKSGNIALQRRADKGMLGGLDVFPTSGWLDGSAGVKDYPLDMESDIAKIISNGGAKQSHLNEKIEHIFTHFRAVLTITLVALDGDTPLLPDGMRWAGSDDFNKAALPTVMVKAAKEARL